jgi:alkanesulfonate monooxygenase
VTSFDPLTLLPALATVTDHLGLIATASTSYNEPTTWRSSRRSII